MWMTLEEIAAYLKVSKETIYKMAQQKKLPCSKLGSQWRFKKELVDIWLEHQSQPLDHNHNTSTTSEATGE